MPRGSEEFDQDLGIGLTIKAYLFPPIDGRHFGGQGSNDGPSPGT